MNQSEKIESLIANYKLSAKATLDSAKRLRECGQIQLALQVYKERQQFERFIYDLQGLLEVSPMDIPNTPRP